MLDLRSLYANPEILATIVAVADRRLAELMSRDWSRRVRAALEGNLAASSDHVARQLGVSRRSLQRKLAAEGATFAGLLAESRHRRALELVQRRGLALRAIAEQLGFADPRAFSRAFRRWTGMGPSTYRAGAPGAAAETPGVPPSAELRP